MIDLGDNLDRAVREARRIRRNLVHLRGNTDLGGDCGLASIFLADALGSPNSLRGTKDLCADPCMTHAWSRASTARASSKDERQPLNPNALLHHLEVKHKALMSGVRWQTRKSRVRS